MDDMIAQFEKLMAKEDTDDLAVESWAAAMSKKMVGVLSDDLLGSIYAEALVSKGLTPDKKQEIEQTRTPVARWYMKGTKKFMLRLEASLREILRREILG